MFNALFKRKSMGILYKNYSIKDLVANQATRSNLNVHEQVNVYTGCGITVPLNLAQRKKGTTPYYALTAWQHLRIIMQAELWLPGDCTGEKRKK